MQTTRPYILTIAGFDPSGGAGVLADVKTFEQNKVYGLAVITAYTLQTENSFHQINWRACEEIVTDTQLLLQAYSIRVVKIGIVKDLQMLNAVVSCIHAYDPTIKIILDPVLKTSTGFDFWDENTTSTLFQKILSKTFLITPNYEEVAKLSNNQSGLKAAKSLAAHTQVLLKGGHNTQSTGVDYLFTKDKIFEMLPLKQILFSPKHGSGCVLSSAIAANLALGYDIIKACQNAKYYITTFLSSNQTLLGYHYA